MGTSAAKAMTAGVWRDIKAFTKQLEKKIQDDKIRIANHAAYRLMSYAPVWTGTYVKSFRAGLGIVDTSAEGYSHGVPPFPPRMPESAAEALRLKKLQSILSAIKTAKPFVGIKLSNSLDYADKVEFVGWPQFGQPPHFVFELASLDTANFIRQIVTRGNANGL